MNTKPKRPRSVLSTSQRIDAVKLYRKHVPDQVREKITNPQRRLDEAFIAKALAKKYKCSTSTIRQAANVVYCCDYKALNLSTQRSYTREQLKPIILYYLEHKDTKTKLDVCKQFNINPNTFTARLRNVGHIINAQGKISKKKTVHRCAKTKQQAVDDYITIYQQYKDIDEAHTNAVNFAITNHDVEYTLLRSWCIKQSVWMMKGQTTELTHKEWLQKNEK